MRRELEPSMLNGDAHHSLTREVELRIGRCIHQVKSPQSIAEAALVSHEFYARTLAGVKGEPGGRGQKGKGETGTWMPPGMTPQAITFRAVGAFKRMKPST